MNPAQALHGLASDAAATFALSPAGRIQGENDPDHSPGPRLFLAGCPGGNLVRLRHDVGEGIAARIQALVANAPAWSDPETRPACLAGLVDLLAREGPPEVLGSAVVHALPRGLVAATRAGIVRSDTEAGALLLARLARDGMPKALVEAGFVGIGDFWDPWCVALEGREIAAVAFAARTGREGASIGVYTFPAFRGRGQAAAVTAAWADHPSLAGRTLFYSALFANASSLRVIDRLGLPRLGVSLRIL